ncbi:MAG: 3-isopropylmalate dehydratase small subunit [Blastocatellia bacterium]
MERFKKHSGYAVVIDIANIDTDQIIPKQFLKRIERTGYGEFLFYDWRFNSDGSLKTDFVLNDPRFKKASILVAGENFGCGSSREHAPWSLLDYGFRVVIAPSFADIFFNNSLKNGLLPVALDSSVVAQIADSSQTKPDLELTIDLEEQIVTSGDEFSVGFKIDPFQRHCLLNGLDDIALTLEHEEKISAFEQDSGIPCRFTSLTS